MAIAGGGVGLVEHATDPRTPASAAWLLAGAVAVVLASIATAAQALPRDDFPPGVIAAVPAAYAAAAATVLLIAAVRPSPIVFVTSVSLTLAALSLRSFALVVRNGRRSPEHANQ